jgi:hypothetical protein
MFLHTVNEGKGDREGWGSAFLGAPPRERARETRSRARARAGARERGSFFGKRITTVCCCCVYDSDNTNIQERDECAWVGGVKRMGRGG